MKTFSYIYDSEYSILEKHTILTLQREIYVVHHLQGRRHFMKHTSDIKKPVENGILHENNNSHCIKISYARVSLKIHVLIP